MISTDQIKALVQSILMIGGTVAVSKGLLSSDQAAAVTNEVLVIVGSLGTIVGAVWNHTNADAPAAK